MLAILLLCTPIANANADHQTAWSGDIAHFETKDLPRWRSGHWSHAYHDGQMGWWWIIGDERYLYATATYPYPDPFRPIGQTTEIAANHGTQYRYYCSRPAGYYPYISKCEHLWRRVASITLKAVAPQPPIPMPMPTSPPPAPEPKKIEPTATKETRSEPSIHKPVQAPRPVVKKIAAKPEKIIKKETTPTVAKQILTPPQPPSPPVVAPVPLTPAPSPPSPPPMNLLPAAPEPASAPPPASQATPSNLTLKPVE